MIPSNEAKKTLEKALIKEDEKNEEVNKENQHFDEMRNYAFRQICPNCAKKIELKSDCNVWIEGGDYDEYYIFCPHCNFEDYRNKDKSQYLGPRTYFRNIYEENNPAVDKLEVEYHQQKKQKKNLFRRAI